MVQLNDGTGGGFSAKVSSLNRLSTQSVVQPQDRAVNERVGKVWSLPFEGVDPTGADDYFFYLKNSGNANIRLTDIRLCSTVAGIAKLKVVTGTASGGTTITPVGRNLGITAILDATVESGADITGLTDGGTLFFYL